MSDHELQSWLTSAVAAADPLCDLIENELPLDDTFGWGARFDAMWNKRALQSSIPGGLLLTGPSGCGRHTAATHMFRILYDSHCALLLDGRELCADGYAAATKRLRYAIDNPRDAGNGTNLSWLLILENMEDCDCRQQLLSWLGQVVDATWTSTAGDSPLFVILIDSREEDIPSILRKHLRLCRMALPTASRRKAYFESDQFPMIQSLVTMDLLVDSTAGLTYAQMVDLARNLECVLYCLPQDQRHFSDAELLDFLAEQMPDPIQEDPLQSLALSARLFIENLPELMTHMGTAVPATVIQAPAQTQAEKATSSDPLSGIDMPSEKDFKEKIIEMPVSDVCNELFGAERFNKIKAKHAAQQRA